MPKPAQQAPNPRARFQFSKIAWTNLAFIAGVHAVALWGLSELLVGGKLSWSGVLFCALSVALTTFAISAGYHRLFSHRTFDTGPILRGVLLLGGAAAFQNSVLEWACKHRRHHHHMDTPLDPYDATRGFWYSHVGWVIERSPPEDLNAPDLQADALVRLQHRYYVPLAILTGLGAPALMGWWLLGSAWHGLLLGGALRLVIAYHMTFSINSVAHWIGSQPYGAKGTARDSWLTALVTMGEGYHNYHHTFPGDYRNGIRLYDFDPPKWAIAALAKLGWVWNLKRTPGHLIALRRVRADREQLKVLSLSQVQRRRLEQAYETVELRLRAWARAFNATRAGGASAARAERDAFWIAYRVWRELLGRAC